MLLAASAAKAGLVFQDRHTDSSGAETTYSFEANSEETASRVDQAKATKIALSWAARYYRVQAPMVADVRARTMPIRFWLIELSESAGTKRETFFAVVLPSGSVVEPMAVRKPAATAALVDHDAPDNSIDPQLTAPARQLEIHGEISFTYGFGKASGRDHRYLNPALDPDLW
jgi:hypothetical protein